MNPFSEDNLVEQTVIKLIKEVWADSMCHINAYTDEEDSKLGRAHRGEVVLTKYLFPALEKLNPGFPKEALDQAVEQVVRDRSHLSLVNANKEIYLLLRDGASVQVMNRDGEYETETARFFDFANPANNSFLCVSQLWVVGEMHNRRPDVVLFVNGIPLILLELKASHKSLVDAYRDNLRDYKDTIPKLLWYNLGIIISNGIENKFGSVTSPYEFFNEWKKAESEDDRSKTDIGTIIRGVCDKVRMLDIFENYILFDESGSGEAKKIVPRYFQYLGVNRAFQKVIDRESNDGKLGVFWHTQGSGKSYSMVYLSQKVFRKLKGNFTFVIVTDRKELDRQSYKNFATVGAVYEKEVHANSIFHLKELLRADHRQIFTTIQKFQDIPKAISERNDIIVMTDEAHRSQYDLWAMNMRRALPNASFIGFTGTPLMVGEEKTRETFGPDVSVYNFADSVRDGATVPLYYENRVPRLTNVNEQLEQEIGKVMEFYEMNDEEEEKLESEFSTFYHLVTREDRLNVIARDIVAHFVGRGYDGKAMVVSVDKKTTFRMYTKVRAEWDRYLGKLRMDLSRTDDEYERTKIEEKLAQHENVDMAVMVSQSQNEIDDLVPFDIDTRPLRNRINTGNLEEEFKKADSNLRIVFVCAMWMTGFDVPNLSTLYLDKPLKNHTLMQAIARVNRVSPGKKNGLIVDYIGVFKNIEKALAVYARTAGGDDKVIRSKDELVGELVVAINLGKDFLKNEKVDLAKLISAPAEEKLLLLEHAANAIVANSAQKKKFLNLAADIQSAYSSVLPDPSAENYYTEVTAIRVIASRVRDVGFASVDVSQVEKDLEALLDRSIQAGEYVIPQHKSLRDLSALNADALHDFFANLDNKNLQAESLSGELKAKIEEMVRRNRKRAKFMERLNSLLKEYNLGAHDIDQLLNDLVALAKDLSEEEKRSVQEGLSEDELAIFDLLQKENLNPDETAKVRLVAKEILEQLKPKLVPGWRDFEPLRAGVKITISDVLFPKLPEQVYTEHECEYKGLEVYNFVYENYRDARVLSNNY
jgi:type I restriction enzyme R subunit